MARSRPDQPDGVAGPAAGVHYKVLARRWRPQQFRDLIGQEPIAQALEGAIAAQRVAHAYLFTGARGVGKTTTARILAKALNCRSGPTRTPCDACDSCEAITSGDDVDVLEIDGASNRGIDEVRELRQNVNLRPTRGRYKVYIIDEVHMLTREAFNALLKTLEEPPDHVKFVFATTDPQKIPITILSRCQRFDFGTIGPERIRKHLEQIIAAEQIAVDPEVLELVTRRAAGSMRDALSLMDQLLAFGGERVTADQVHRLLGTASDERLVELAQHLLDRDAGSAIGLIDEAETQGVQLGELVDQCIEYFRDLMVLSSAGADARLSSVSSAQRARLVQQASARSLEFIFAATDILAETKSRLRGSTHGKILLDIALARIAHLEDLGTLEELAQRLGDLEARLGGSAAVARPAVSTMAAPSVQPADSKKKEPAADAAPRVTPAPGAATESVPPQPHVALRMEGPITNQSAATWIKHTASSFSGVLRESLARAAVSVGPAPDQLVVSLDPMYNTAERAREIETALRERIGSNVQLRVVLSTAAPSGRAAGVPDRRSTYTERLSEATRDPLVQQAMEVFAARVVRVDES